MNNDNLIRLALEFRAVQLWKTLDDAMIFAVRLPDGRIGYCCVMGNGGEHFALGLYIGPEGFANYMRIISQAGGISPYNAVLTYDCLQCDFENSADSNLSADEKKHVKEVAKSYGIKMTRGKSYPEFLRYDYGYLKTKLNHEETVAMEVALKAALAVASRFSEDKNLTYSELGFSNIYVRPDGIDSIPLLTPLPDGTMEWSMVTTPKVNPMDMRCPKLHNSSLADKIKSLPHKGDLMCQVVAIPTPVRTKDGCYYVRTLMIVGPSGQIYPVMTSSETTNNSEDLLNEFAHLLAEGPAAPSNLVTTDGYTAEFLQDFCVKTDIKTVVAPFLPELQMAIEEMMSFYSRGMMF